jgi:hypothetical protein
VINDERHGAEHDALLPTLRTGGKMTISMAWQRWILAVATFCLAPLILFPLEMILTRFQASFPTVGTLPLSPVAELQWFDSNAVRPVDPKRDRIENLAVQEIARRSGTPSDRMQAKAEREADGWRVFVGFLPACPGNFCVLTLTEDGEIKSITGGA